MTDYKGFYANQSIQDPTRTLTLRTQWVNDWLRRVRELKRLVLKSVVENDALGLSQSREDQRRSPFTQSSLPPAAEPQKWAGYRWTYEKVEAFMQWLRQAEDVGILEVTLQDVLRPAGEPWTNVFVRSAYQKGLAFALDNVRRNSNELAVRMGLDESFLTPAFRSTGEHVSILMHQPFHADRLALMYTRTFDELKGITADMDKSISQILTKGMAQGLNPREMGAQLANGIPDLNIGSPFRKAEVRGALIARTETIHTHAQAALNEYEAIEERHGEVILVEWKATLDSRVRPAHARAVDPHRGYNGLVMTRAEAYLRIGEPNCRCALLPYIPAIQGMPSKVTEKARILAQKAVEENDR